ncbi:sigma-70 family RNA polymerase sigma factor [Microcoleus sp. F8_C2]
MKRRRDIVELFSTFLQLDDHYDALGPGWEKSHRLASNITKKIEIEAIANEDFWAQYWLKATVKDSQRTSSAREHLSAYLEEACYWTALKIYQQLAAYQLRRVDCFLMLREVAANPVKLFKNYDYKSSSIKTYAHFPLKSAVLDQVRKGRELDKYTWPALLRAVTKKRLKESLYKANIKEPELSRYLLAWQCFRDKYIPTKAVGSKQLQPPDMKQMEAISVHYNQQRHPKQPTASAQEIQKWLELCVQVIQDCAKTSFVSIEDCTSEPAFISEDLIEEQDAVESEYHQVNQVLLKAFAALPEEAQTLLKLWYGLGMTQSDLALALGIAQQYQVSRTVGKHKQLLLKPLAEWSKQTLEITLNSQQLGEMGKQLDGWLEEHCAVPFRKVLKEALLIPSLHTEIQLLRLMFGQNLKPQQVATELEIKEADIKARINRVQQSLQSSLKSYVENTLQISLASCKSVDKSTANFVEMYLEKAAYATFTQN